jgi:hypothetical protein
MAHTHSGVERARFVHAPASASSAKIQKQITPASAQPRSMLIVAAVWRHQSTPASSNTRRVFHHQTVPT